MVNNLPYTILTKRVRILPTQWKGKTAALRAEFIGCKNGCLKSLGVAQNPPSSGQVINNVADRHVEKTDSKFSSILINKVVINVHFFGLWSSQRQPVSVGIYKKNLDLIQFQHLKVK